MRWREWIWPVIGLAAVAFSIWLLVDELRGISLDDVGAGLAAISWRQWLLSALAALLAYAALAGYDHMALLHLGKKVNWLFVTACSFSTYALSHNIGGSVISGAVIRYRAYGTKGLSPQEVGVLVALCSLTFALATILLGGILLVLKPSLIERVQDDLPAWAGLSVGIALLLLVTAYVFGSWMHFRPFRIAGFQLHYPRLPIVVRQLIIGPLEILAAISIIYFALPAAGNPGFLTVAAVFLASFTVAQLSHAPGGLGVLEVVFIKGLPEMDEIHVLSALLVFRLLYLLIPLLISIVLVIAFERSQLAMRWARPLAGNGK
ncbi:lysylphosphatidylglycerol synthase transmembrane domain-containing protein [Arvimicrobium flavum]|uniref:lysylphosphatidylglycerol synthase transmembrane domain-containing protein n=1 Tax=Arvimicrobium flavum TaxID=3393320 RepID=UPI00237A4CEC|nr:YbhN family protein [Mesorhizobium shangrilense]